MIAPLCTHCGAETLPWDRFCGACGQSKSEAPVAPVVTLRVHRFNCQGCGAQMSFSAADQALRCPFCDGLELIDEGPSLSPPGCREARFQVNEEAALAALRNWLSGRWFAPSDLVHRAEVREIRAVRLPVWVVMAKVSGTWARDRARRVAKGSAPWVPEAGRFEQHHVGVVVCASRTLTHSEVQALKLAPPDEGSDTPPPGIPAEVFALGRQDLRRLATPTLRNLSVTRLHHELAGRSRNLSVSLQIEELEAMPARVPMWVLSYSYRGKALRILVCGRRSLVVGESPWSWRKVLAAAIFLGGVAWIALACWQGRFSPPPGEWILSFPWIP